MANLEGHYISVYASRWGRADRVEPSRVEQRRLVGPDRSRGDWMSRRHADGGGLHSSRSLVNICTADGGGLHSSRSLVNMYTTDGGGL